VRDPDDAKGVICRWAEKTPTIRRVHLFGSRVRGTDKHGQLVRPTSDLDIAVELTISDVSAAQLAFMDMGEHWQAELSELLPFPIDLEWFDPPSMPILVGHLMDCSVVIFERA
jgi:predicted nucleotidyltransferase